MDVMNTAMRLHRSIKFGLALALAAVTGLQRAPSPAAAADLFAQQWSVQTIHAATAANQDHGVRPSMMMHPAWQRPIVAWHEGGQGGLVAAFAVNPGTGTCNGGGVVAANKGYSCFNLDTGGKAGYYSTIVRNPVDLDTYFIHSDPDTSEVRSLRYSLTGGAPIYRGIEVLNTVDNNALFTTKVANFVTAASNGSTVRTAFWTFNQHLNGDYYWGGAQAGDVHESSQFFLDGFQRDVNSPYTIGYYPSMDWYGAAGAWAMAYRGGNGVLRYTDQYYTGNPTGCSTVSSMGSWTCVTVDPTGTIYGTSLVSAKTNVDRTRISYYHSGSGAIKMASYVGGASTCGAGGAAGWKCETIETVLPSGTLTAVQTSMVVVDGRAYIAYSDHNHAGNSVIKIARPVGGASGNCGSGNWQCDVVDGGSGINNLEWPVMKANDDGRLFIAYHDKTMRSLKLASQRAATAVTLTKQYLAASVVLGSNSTIDYRLTNNSGIDADALFDDELVAGQQLVGTSSFIGPGCVGAQVTLVSNFQKVMVKLGSMPDGTTCLISVPVKATKIDTLVDATSQVFSNDTVTGAAATATLSVTAPPLPPPPTPPTPTPSPTPVPGLPPARVFLPGVVR